MDFSYNNAIIWNGIVQFGLIAFMLLFANLLRRKVPFVRNSLMPTAVLGGFVLLVLRNTGLVNVDTELLEVITYHGIALGFIALSLRVPHKSKEDKENLIPPKSGALIVSTYLVQGILGLAISLILAYTFMPDLFKASGILLPMGYGQGPGQANNVGSTYEALGFVGGRSFGLSIAAAGYLSACVVGVIYLNVMKRKGSIKTQTVDPVSGSVTVDTFQDENEIPIEESVDKLSVQVALVLIVYLIAFLLTRVITGFTATAAPGLDKTISPLLWGFNFIVGSLVAMLVRVILSALKKKEIMTRQYQNNYLLSRISGLAFDIMIIAGIASIEISDISGLWAPFLLMTVLGAILTMVYLQWLCKRVYPNYYYEAFTSMYGMLTGTISSGVLLLREVDPGFRTPAANNLLTGSSFAIVFGAPMLLLIGIAPESTASAFLVLGLMAAYLALLLLFMLRVNGKSGNRKQTRVK
ncbi:MAG: hypothetical protein PHO41_06420 [Eubacteriales bacterium]|nr:hypothetical protein [Eubacteriales bacterium]